MLTENVITTDKHVLLYLKGDCPVTPILEHLLQQFCGTIVEDLTELLQDTEGKRLYVCGDLTQLGAHTATIHVIEELSYHYEAAPHRPLIRLGEVPLLVHGVGVYFRALFEEANYFERIEKEHVFQALTESTKPSKAFRKGIYLTEIQQDVNTIGQEQLHYRLLRCSSNFMGPTDNFRATDHTIIQTVNEAATSVFEQAPHLNHVLAQIYQNVKKENNKETKAKISAHSDKTKDMLAHGLIAFCTFYHTTDFQTLKPSTSDPYDWVYKGKTGLTQLHFKLKDPVQHPDLVQDFRVTLYPNSVFLIPLSTNRLYTHAIKPSMLNIDRIPTRMGYVVRSSKAEAVHVGGQTYLKEGETLIPLVPMTLETMTDLRHSYYEENSTSNQVAYGKVHFSMNAGDYEKPIY